MIDFDFIVFIAISLLVHHPCTFSISSFSLMLMSDMELDDMELDYRCPDLFLSRTYRVRSWFYYAIYAFFSFETIHVYFYNKITQ